MISTLRILQNSYPLLFQHFRPLLIGSHDSCSTRGLTGMTKVNAASRVVTINNSINSNSVESQITNAWHFLLSVCIVLLYWFDYLKDNSFVLRTVAFWSSSSCFSFLLPRVAVRCQFLPPAGAKCEQVEAKANYVVCSVSTCWPRQALLGVILCFVNSLFLWPWLQLQRKARGVCLSIKNKTSEWLSFRRNTGYISYVRFSYHV